ncbi:kinase-like protein [Cristinia sonorae]|uniref:non-specific serine/threonine protein kinase n=1 Tax=Cristinia sonorae TaxID=1940300 RepID=A0A8K0UK93_9AGAR|nr:kinase-like protein [Cristinia sonorae]
MSAAALLSGHSSNPLEVHSSDRHNRAYKARFMAAKREAGTSGAPSSDDPLNSFNEPVQEYQTHVSALIPHAEMTDSARARTSWFDAAFVDLDADMDSDVVDGGDVVEVEADMMDEFDGEDVDIEELDDLEDDDEDAQGETDEEMTIHLKPPEEQEEIAEEIADLEAAVPQLVQDYKIVDRLGTGTFSSVYKAIDLHYHTKWDNSVWHGVHPPSSSAYYQSAPRPSDTKVFVAIKRIYVTSGPERIRNEITIMEDCRGSRHVSQLITAFRQQDQVVAIMPYHRHEDFRVFYNTLPMEGIKEYFRCLFRAFRDIHTRKIIHRDVKPANFLFDPKTGIGTLCDFGLACRNELNPNPLGSCLHTGSLPKHPHGKVLHPREYDGEQLKKAQKESRVKSSLPSDRVGYPEKDTRPHSKANRAGTRGFRAPEVLLKCGDQTGAIDMWAAGMILLSFLTEKFPLFNSNDDIEALMEIATIIGRKRMERTATLHSRLFQSNVPSITLEGISWTEFVERQNPNLRVPREPVPYYYPYSTMPHRARTHPPSSSSPTTTRYSESVSPQPDIEPPSEESHIEDVKNALDLLEQLMQPECVRRITPRKALYHPFLHDPLSDVGDDEYFPHPFGQGICAKYHFRDDVTDEMCVRVRVPGTDEMEVRILQAGEGLAIGREPCEFHKDEEEFLER